MKQRKELFKGAIDDDGKVIANHTNIPQPQPQPQPQQRPIAEPPRLKVVKSPEPKDEPKTDNTAMYVMIGLLLLVVGWFIFENYINKKSDG